MKYQDLFSLKNKKKNFECRLLQILLGALRVKSLHIISQMRLSEKSVVNMDGLKNFLILPNFGYFF